MWLAALVLGCGPADPTDEPTPTPTTDGDTHDTGPTGLVLPDSCAPPTGLTADPLTASGSLDVTRIAPGTIHMTDIELDPAADLAYVANVRRLMTFDVSGPTAQLLGNVQVGTVERVELLGNGRVALAGRDSGVFIIDATDPTQLAQLRRLRVEDASGLAVSDAHLFVATLTGSLHVFELAGLAEVTTVTGLSQAWELARTGDVLLAADNTAGLIPIDISDPTAPVVLSAVATAGGALDISIDGTHAYVAEGAAGIEVFSLADPRAPVRVAGLDPSGSAVSVDVADGVLWSANHEGVYVADVADPAAPFGLSSEPTEQWALHVAGRGTRGFVADWGALITLQVDPTVRAPRLVLDQPELFFSGDEGRVLVASNEGSAPLVLSGATLDDPRFSLVASADTIEPGEEARLDVTFADDGAPVDASLCLASNDPQDPTLQVPLLSTSSTGSSLAIGQPAVDFVLPDLDGNLHQLSDHLGVPVVLAYFATW